jgi:gas vesicle protein
MGAAIGSIVSLLYAPASGKAMRKQLASRAKDLRKRATRRIGQTRKHLACQAEQVREAATEWIKENVPHTNGRHAVQPRVRHAAR